MTSALQLLALLGLQEEKESHPASGVAMVVCLSVVLMFITKCGWQQA